MGELKMSDTAIATTQAQDISKIEPATEPDEIVVMANKPDGVQKSLVALSAQMDQRITHWKREVRSLKANLELAKKNKLRQEPIKNALVKAQRRVEFYVKLKGAFDAGYVPVPTFPGVDVFAVRVKRKKPVSSSVEGEIRSWDDGPHTHDVSTDTPPLGEGRNVSSRPIEGVHNYTKKQEAGKPDISMVQRWASGYQDEIDFPFVLAKPEIVQATTEAMAMHLFDEIGVSPGRSGRTGGTTPRTADPMVIGRIVLRNGPQWQWKRVSFLVGWFIDTTDL
jgi:hypothetical protein